MISTSAIWNSSPRLANARTKMDLLLFIFFALGSSAENDAMALPKKLSILIHWESLIAYRFLFLSFTRASTLLEDIAVLEAAGVCLNGGCVRCIEERYCGDPWNLMITARWVSTVTHILMNKHLRIPKSGTSRIG